MVGNYQDGSVPTFTADVDGTYDLQLQAHLVFADRGYSDDGTLRKKMREILRKHMMVDEELDEEVGVKRVRVVDANQCVMR